MGNPLPQTHQPNNVVITDYLWFSFRFFSSFFLILLLFLVSFTTALCLRSFAFFAFDKKKRVSTIKLEQIVHM